MNLYKCRSMPRSSPSLFCIISASTPPESQHCSILSCRMAQSSSSGEDCGIESSACSASGANSHGAASLHDTALYKSLRGYPQCLADFHLKHRFCQSCSCQDAFSRLPFYGRFPVSRNFDHDGRGFGRYGAVCVFFAALLVFLCLSQCGQLHCCYPYRVSDELDR